MLSIESIQALAVTALEAQLSPEKEGKDSFMNQFLKCPVCEWEIKDGGIAVEVNGDSLVVCCDECAQTAQESAKQAAV